MGALSAAGAQAASRPFVLVQDVPASWERYAPIERSLEAVPRGLVLHVAGPTDEGFRIVEVWESEADWLAFAESTGLALAEVDPAVGARPVVRVFATAHVVMGGSIAAPDGPVAPRSRPLYRA